MARRMRIERVVVILLFLMCLIAGVWLVEYGDPLTKGISATAKVSEKPGTANYSDKYPLAGAAIEEETASPEIGLYFCPRDNCEQHLFELLDSANVSIHCATYELNLPRIISLLKNKSRDGVEVRLVVDNEYFDEVENLSFARHDGKQGLMHDKFCVVDKRVIYTGSFNPTSNCAYRNNNNMVVIESKYLSENYEAEFSELWAGEFGEGRKVAYPLIRWNNITIRNYFCPEDGCRERVRAEIGKANSSIYFMAFSFTDDYIGRALVAAHEGGVDVRGVFEKTKLSNYSEYNLLKYQGIDVRTDINRYNMHHKVFIIDNRTVITGSFNPTANANYDNDENILVIEDQRIAGLYQDEFYQIYNSEK